MISPSKQYRITEVADILGLNQRTVYNLLEKGALKSRKFGGARRVGADQLDEYLKATECQDPSNPPTSQNAAAEKSGISLTTMATDPEKSARAPRFMKLPSMR